MIAVNNQTLQQHVQDKQNIFGVPLTLQVWNGCQ